MELHDLKSLLQDHLGDGLVAIVGSGLSCAEGMPGMGELASHLCATVPGDIGTSDGVLWAKISSVISSMGLEAALLAHAPSQRLETAIAARTVELIAAREREIISDVFAKKRILQFTRLLTHMLKPETGLPVITTNYDRLIEVAAEEAGLGADTLFIGQFAGALNEQESRLSFCREVTLRGKQIRWRFRPRVSVFKPHGSLDWYYRDGQPVRYSGDLPIPRLVITPGLNKFRNGYESPFDRHRERANSAIDKASRFLIIGYGFNDDHLETHLTPRIRTGVPTLLLTYELSPNAEKLARQCDNLIAIQRDTSGPNGCIVYVNKSPLHFPDLALWNVKTFITEVLEP